MAIIVTKVMSSSSYTPAAAAKTDVSSDSEEGEVKVKEETGQIKRSLGK